MKVLVTGGRGFIGSAVKEELSRTHEVYTTCVEVNHKDKEFQVDLSDANSVKKVLSLLEPEAIVNCAGIVTNDEKAQLNEVFTKNLLHSVDELGLSLRRMVILGSAAEYGEVDPRELPIDETAPLNATSLYGLSKVRETTYARTYAEENNIPLVVARIFNPIGANMPPRMLITGLQRQTQEILAGLRHSIDVSRLDSERDYVDVRDVAAVIENFLRKSPIYDVYNIGTGVATTTRELVDFVLNVASLGAGVKVLETSKQKETTVASKANIARIYNEYGWSPKHTLEDVINEVFNGIN